LTNISTNIPLIHRYILIESKISKMRATAYKNNKLIITKTNGDKKEITFAYDTLYEIGYIEDEGTKFEADYSFFRYMADLNEYTNPDTNVERQIVKLFGGIHGRLTIE